MTQYRLGLAHDGLVHHAISLRAPITSGPAAPTSKALCGATALRAKGYFKGGSMRACPQCVRQIIAIERDAPETFRITAWTPEADQEDI